MTTTHRTNRLSLALLALLLGFVWMAGTAHAFPPPVEEEYMEDEDEPTERVYSPHVGRDYPDQVLFGDTHFHTDLSFDAGLIGTTLTAHEGFRFARGEKVISNTGQPVQLIRPLDFLAITDHAEMMGMAPAIRTSDPILLSDPWGKWAHDRFRSGQEGRMEVMADIIKQATVNEVNPFSSNELTESICASVKLAVFLGESIHSGLLNSG